MLEELRQIYWVAFVVALIFILWKGGVPERLGAATVVAMAVLQFSLLVFMRSSRFDAVDLGSLVTDVVGFAGFGILALNARRIWPLWATALQLLSLGAHFARWVSLDMAQQIYAITRSTPTAIVVVLMVLATAFHIQAVKRGTSGADWQDWDQFRH
ncbi:hypothetical protein B2G71_19390 [Novosphingobium sp. PC22D]|uniref:Rod shape-determining protein MreD n=2 Tax=Novosphingobium TaxID=165696 RepID=A0ABQ2JRZ5_9SPHN|nr:MULTISPECIES: hypothetical protein [Novosphingobium]MCJ2180114.1 hypothetical protein [Novosphingobium album (ex Hu et al. 2023)]PEQ10983.1 hypothetical protein B2G71_19390 [Novosphingobium sp. PC22D]GGN55326.1 hypothetical protein GCM10011349_31840 [Novosphingobium indicum]